MEGIPKIKDVVELTEKELSCKFTKYPNIDYMFEAGKDYCLFSPVSLYANDEYFILKIDEAEHEALMDHTLSLLIIRHFGGFLSILKFKDIDYILTQKSLIQHEDGGDKYYELHIYNDHISIKNSQIAVNVGLTKV